MKFAVLGNAVVDCVAHVPDAVLEKHNLIKGQVNVLPLAAFLEVSAAVPAEGFKSGGASANMAWTLAKLGHSVSFLGRCGADATGKHFTEDMLAAGVAMPALADKTSQTPLRTMEIFVLITPDGARTFVEMPPLAPDTTDAWVHEEAIEAADWLVISAYTLAANPAACQFAARLARKVGTPLGLLLGSAHAVKQALPEIETLLEHGTPLIIGNEKEWDMLPKHKLSGTACVITHSGKGATLRQSVADEIFGAVTLVANPTDKTGAGDAFAAGFLAVWNGSNAEEALRRGNQLARACVQHVGPRLPDPKAAWNGTLAPTLPARTSHAA